MELAPSFIIAFQTMISVFDVKFERKMINEDAWISNVPDLRSYFSSILRLCDRWSLLCLFVLIIVWESSEMRESLI